MTKIYTSSWMGVETYDAKINRMGFARSRGNKILRPSEYSYTLEKLLDNVRKKLTRSAEEYVCVLEYYRKNKGKP